MRSKASIEEVIKRLLRDFNSSSDDGEELVWGSCREEVSIDSYLFPVPGLILYVLHELHGFPLGYCGDKTHWTIPFVYQCVSCAISFEKSGLHLYADRHQADQINLNKLLGKLKKAIEVVEKHVLTEIAQDQIKSGNITIPNRFHFLNGQYHYFRDQAASSYSSLNPASFNEIVKINSESVYNSLAMIDAYFSRLEHFLVLALPFSSYDRAVDNLVNFVGSIWSDKIKRVMGLENPKIHNYYNRLLEVKEKYRNTFAHGGFEKKGQSFYFHLPEVGAIPASMSGYKDSVYFNFFPIREPEFRDVCILFDEFDSLLESVTLPQAWQFAKSGIDLILEENYLLAMLATVNNPKEFDEWLSKMTEMFYGYVNVEY